MSLTLTYDPAIARVRLAATALTGASTALFERSANGLLWTTVRGGTAVTVTGGAANLDDYEFAPGVTNYYRVTGSPGGVTFSQTIAPVQNDVWLKSVTKPFLNRIIKVVDHSDISRPSRSGVFEVIDRTLPVAVTSVPSSRRWTMIIKADTIEEADEIDLVLSSGDVMFIQPGGTLPTSSVPGGYVLVTGDVQRRRFGVKSVRRWFDIPLTEVAAPDPSVYGIPATWDTISAEYGSWNGLVANQASWNTTKAHISSSSVVIVP